MKEERQRAARTASENVAEQIRGRIATGALKPGDMLPSETSLLDEFGVARPTMREALRILESDGLITIVFGVNGGALVREPDLATLARRAGLHLQMRGVQIADLMGALRILQPGAVALAATAATPAQISLLRAQVDKVEQATDIGTFVDEGIEFLSLLMRACGNETLGFIATLLDQLVHAQGRANAIEQAPGADVERDFRAWAVDQYTRLVDHIEAGEAEKAEALWRRHLHIVPPYVDGTSRVTVYPSLGATEEAEDGKGSTH